MNANIYTNSSGRWIVFTLSTAEFQSLMKRDDSLKVQERIYDVWREQCRRYGNVECRIECEPGPQVSNTCVTRLEGYIAAFKVIDKMLADAEKERPKRVTLKMQRSAAFREGFHRGLCAASCQATMGEWPEQNRHSIIEALGQQKRPSSTPATSNRTNRA
jgi:hypothetical protein